VTAHEATQWRSGVVTDTPVDLAELHHESIGSGLGAGDEGHGAVEVENDTCARAVLAETQAGRFGEGAGIRVDGQQHDDRAHEAAQSEYAEVS
jgi:hypothetical protein